MDKVNSPVRWWLRAISWVPDDGAVVQPSRTPSSQRISASVTACRYSVYEAYATRQTASAECSAWRPMARAPSIRFASTRRPQEDRDAVRRRTPKPR
jgi:hypothetical protein